MNGTSMASPHTCGKYRRCSSSRTSATVSRALVVSQKKSSEKTHEWLLKFGQTKCLPGYILPFIFIIIFCHHRFSGAVAIMLSGLKARGLKWSPFSVKRALAHIAQPIPNMCHYGQGNGLIQVTFITILAYEVSTFFY